VLKMLQQRRFCMQHALKPCSTDRCDAATYAEVHAGHGQAFVQTKSVEGHLRSLARAVLLRRHPILLQVRD
jgi:hypothetical protein